MEVTSKKCSKCHTEKDFSQYTKNSKCKYGFSSYCKDCRNKQKAIYREKNREKINKKNREIYHQNIESERDRNRKYHKRPEVLERLRIKAKLKYSNNKELYLNRSKKWAKNNKVRRTYNHAISRLRLLSGNRFPVWSNREAILEVYKKRHLLTMSTGVNHHVDHIIPLSGDNVSGLHVANNLNVITASENSSKNKFFCSESHTHVLEAEGDIVFNNKEFK